MGFLSSLWQSREVAPVQATPVGERRGITVVPDGLWRSAQLGQGTAAGLAVSPAKAMYSTAVYACVRILAETLASLPLPLYERLADGGKRRAVGHPLYSLLHDLPNPEMSSFELRETLMGHLALWGNAYAEVEFDRGGRPLHLWPLRPDRMQVERPFGGELVYRYSVGEETDGRRESVDFADYQIFHLRGLGGNGIVGYSPIALMREAVGLALATEGFGARFFGNDARPGGVLEHPGVLGDEEHERLANSWESRHQGLEKSHRIAILEEGMKYNQIGIPPEDAQFLETRKFQVTEIARAFRIPPHMLADLERATFSNIEHQSIEFVMHTIRPWLVRWEQAIYRDLLLPEERGTFFAEFMVEGLLRGDLQSRYQAYSIARQNGWMSANDIRTLENMNVIEGGDVYLVPLNMIPADQVGGGLMRARAGEDGERMSPAGKKATTRAFRESGEFDNSVMLALYPPVSVADEIAGVIEPLPNATPSDELHVTLLYLGETEGLDRARLETALQIFANHRPVLTGRLNGTGRFSGDEERYPFYANFDSNDLAAFREGLVQLLAGIGVESASEHGFTPHMTLAYLPQGTATPDVVLPSEPFTIDTVSLSWGTERVDYALGWGKRSQEERGRLPQRTMRSATSRQRLQRAHVPVYRDVAARILRREINDVGGKAKSMLKKRSVPEFLQWLDIFYEQHTEFVMTQMSAVMAAYSELVAAEVGDEALATIDEARLARFVQAYLATYAGRHVALSKSAVIAAMASSDPLATLEETFEGWREVRPTTIANDESVRAGGAVAKFVYGLAGVLFLRWVARGENCAYCRGLDGRVVGIDEVFLQGGEDFEPDGASGALRPGRSVGHPPAHRGCDCVIVAERG